MFDDCKMLTKYNTRQNILLHIPCDIGKTRFTFKQLLILIVCDDTVIGLSTLKHLSLHSTNDLRCLVSIGTG